MENNLKVQGFVLLDVDVVALNNSGADTSSNFDNSVKVFSGTPLPLSGKKKRGRAAARPL